VAACQKTRAPARAEAPDPVVARIDDTAIYRSDVAREATAQDKPASDPGLIDILIDRRLLADEAARQGLDRTAEGRRRLDAARDRVLSDMMLEDRLKGAVTPEVVAGLYQEMEKARPAGSPPETLDQARPRIVRFLTYERVKDLVLDLRHRAKIVVVPPTPVPGAPKS
jgi:hypothetical protein